MNSEQLQTWLLEHATDIARFTDFELVFSSEDALRENLEKAWFRDPLWNQPGYRFVPLGQDGTGSEVALWLRPCEPGVTPVVFFGSEGGSGVLAASAVAFAQALAYGPLVEEYQRGDLDAPSRLSVEDNWFLSDESPEQATAARSALARYRGSTEKRLGPLLPFDSLISIPSSVQAEFLNWVTSVQRRVSERDAVEQGVAAELKREALRAKASEYAALSTDWLPPNHASLRDGSKFAASCAACGEQKALRLTRFEEFTFGLCVRCYFSNAW